jgi:predicted small secreted protein
VTTVVAAAFVLTACGATAPPSRELADEIIDTLEVSDEVKACMRQEVADFQLTDQELQGFDSFDEVASKASQGQEQAKAIMARFQAALASCNTPG